MKKRLISMLCASTIAFLLALPSYAFDSDTVVVNAYTKWNSEDISIRFTQ